MLSILIPEYNYNCFDLVNELNQQALNQNISYEIIVMDDFSTQPATENKKINELQNCQFIELTENVGRSKIRNYLAKKAQYENLLFLDCDSTTHTESFIQRYISFCKEANIVVCGGRLYESTDPTNSDQYLHWYYGSKREVIPASERQVSPYHSFMSNNFLISKTLFEKIRFNEQITIYGHEDTLFGIELKKLGVKIYHIDNPLIHIGLETPEQILKKEEDSINNLIFIGQQILPLEILAEEIKLLKYGIFLKKLYLTGITAGIFKLFRKKIIQNIKGKKPSLFLLDIYKLGYLCQSL